MMYQRIRNLVFHALIPAVLAVFLLPQTASAAQEACTVSIPVEIQVTGDNVPAGQSYRLVLEGITPQAPVPETAELVVEGPGTAEFGEITYQVPGDYRYRIYQNSGTAENFTFDQTVYTLTVQVTLGEEGNLEAQLWAMSSNSGNEKVSRLVFANQYAAGGGNGGDNGNGNGSGTGGNGGGGGGRGDRDPGTGGGPGGATIGDPDAPLANLENISDEDVPLATNPILQAIEDVLVPLGLLPKTGDGSVSYTSLLTLLAVSGALIIFLVWRRRKKTA